MPSTTVSNHCKYETFRGNVKFHADQFKIALMNNSFTFNPDTHSNYSDISGSELATGNGYTAGGLTLTGVSVTQNDTSNRVDVTWDNATWSASGGSIGPSNGAIVYDNTPAAAGDKTVVMYFAFDSAITKTDGQVLTITDIAMKGL